MASAPADECERALALRDVLDLAERIDRAKAAERRRCDHDDGSDAHVG